MKTAEQLAQFAEKVYTENWPYMWGGYGRRVWSLGKYVRKSDCYGIRKACSWDTGITSIYNHDDDRNVMTAYNIARVKGTIDTVPDRRGIVVCQYYNSKKGMGHAGFTVGNGEAIDTYMVFCHVRKRKISEGRWTHWFEDTSINYALSAHVKNVPVPVNPYTRPTRLYKSGKWIYGNDALWIIWHLKRKGVPGLLDGVPVVGGTCWKAIWAIQKQFIGRSGDAGIKTYYALES